jgi:hypothetical protein
MLQETYNSRGSLLARTVTRKNMQFFDSFKYVVSDVIQ